MVGIEYLNPRHHILTRGTLSSVRADRLFRDDPRVKAKPDELARPVVRARAGYFTVSLCGTATDRQTIRIPSTAANTMNRKESNVQPPDGRIERH